MSSCWARWPGTVVVDVQVVARDGFTTSEQQPAGSATGKLNGGPLNSLHEMCYAAFAENASFMLSRHKIMREFGRNEMA